jgi:hypothetical protein
MNEIRLTGRHYLAVALPDAVADGAAFALTVTAKNGHHDALGSAYPSAQVTLSATIDGEACELSPEVIDLTNGTWTGNVTATFPENANLTQAFQLIARTVEPVYLIADGYPKHEYQAEGWDETVATTWGLVFAAAPSAVTRAENFLISIEARDNGGTLLTDVSGTVTLALTGAATGDALSVGTLTMTAGVATLATVQISGGTGGVTGVTISAELDGFDTEESDPFSITLAAGIYTIGKSAHGAAYGQGADEVSYATALSEANSMVNAAAINLLGNSYAGFLGLHANGGIEGYSAWDFDHYEYRGWLQFSVGAYKGSVKGARFRNRTMAQYYTWTTASPYASGWGYETGLTLDITCLESVAAIATGADFLALTPTISIPASTLNEGYKAVNTTLYTNNYYSFDLGKAVVDFINAMDGSDLYLAFRYRGSVDPGAVVSPNKMERGGLDAQVGYVSLELLT